MIGLIRCCRYPVICVCLGIVLVSSVSSQQSDERLERVFKDWKNRQERIKSIKYAVRGEKIVPKGSVRDPETLKPVKPEKPSRDINCKIERTLLLDLAAQRHKFEVNEQYYDNLDGHVHSMAMTRLYDGKVIKGYQPREKNTGPSKTISDTSPNMGVGTGDLRNASFDPTHYPFFYGHGIVALLRDRIAPGKLMIIPDKELLLVHGHGVHDGHTCLVLRSHPVGSGTFEELWVDPTRDSAIVRHVVFQKNRLPRADYNIKYQMTSHGWLPRQWTYVLYDASGAATIFEERLQVAEVAINVPVSDSDFDIEAPPGTLNLKTHYTTPKNSTKPPKRDSTLYRANDDGVWDEVIVEDDVVKKHWRVSPWWLVALLPVAFFGLFQAYRIRVRRRTQ